MTEAIFNHLWQSTLFALAVGVLTLGFRVNRAKVRYWLWFSASIKFMIPMAGRLHSMDTSRKSRAAAGSFGGPGSSR